LVMKIRSYKAMKKKERKVNRREEKIKNSLRRLKVTNMKRKHNTENDAASVKNK